MKTKNKKIERENYFADIDHKAIQISKWCVMCYPEHEFAAFTYDGNSLCEDHFKSSIPR